MPQPKPASALVTVNELPEPRARFAWSRQSCRDDLTVHLFRCVFNVAVVPKTRRIVVTADSRYVLWLNGDRLGRGPLKGTLDHYHAEVYELAGRLRPGRNVLAAEVRWLGRSAPLSEVHSAQPGWFVQELEGTELDTPGIWRVSPDDSVAPGWEDPYDGARKWLGPLDRMDATRRPRDWQGPDFDDRSWIIAHEVGGPLRLLGWGEAPSHQLYPSDLPPLTEEPQDFARVWRHRQPVSLPWTVPAAETGELWLDAGGLTTSYPVLEFSGGLGREVRIVYAEGLGRWEERDGRRRWIKQGRRDDVATLEPHGYRDVVILPGSDFVFEPFHWRTFWFIKLEFPPGPAPVTLRSIRHRFTTYPQNFTARFTCDDPDIDRLWSTSLRTLQLCAHETYEDCPYYEQLNYTGDTRLQAMASHYLANDVGMGRRCLRLFHESLGPDGLTASRVPACGRQNIPAFSLHWILMLHDHWWWTGPADRAFVAEALGAVDAILRHFRERILDHGFVGRVREWDWTDWVRGWPKGVSPAVGAGTGSTFLTALYVLALDAGAELHRSVGEPGDATRWTALAQELRPTLASAWDENAGYFSEGPGRTSDPFTQHAQTMTILAGGATDAQRARIGARLVDDEALVPMSLFHRFYLARALAATGRYDRFFPSVLAPWRVMMANGLSTWQEQVDPTRSDCHAWSSWPVIAFLADILGAQPGAPGWTSILVKPQFQATSAASGALDTPTGRISITWTTSGEQVDLEIDAPEGVPVSVSLPEQSPRNFPAGGRIHLSTPRSPT